MRADGRRVVYFDNSPACGSLTTHGGRRDCTEVSSGSLDPAQALQALGSFGQSTHTPVPHLVQASNAGCQRPYQVHRYLPVLPVQLG